MITLQGSVVLWRSWQFFRAASRAYSSFRAPNWVMKFWPSGVLHHHLEGRRREILIDEAAVAFGQLQALEEIGATHTIGRRQVVEAEEGVHLHQPLHTAGRFAEDKVSVIAELVEHDELHVAAAIEISRLHALDQLGPNRLSLFA